MRICVTGGAGFIGSTIVDAYIKAGHRVWIVDNMSSGRKQNINPKARFIKADVNDRKKLERLFKSVKFDLVNHHAAQIDVRKSVEDPAYDARINILGLLNILNLCRLTNVKKIVFSSSGGTIYGECRRPATESFPEIPLAPYGVSKLAGEKYIQSFAGLFGLQYTIFRYSNVFGPRQDPHGEAGVVAIFSRRLLENEQVFIYGTGKQTRDFVFVKDVAAANVKALTGGKNQIINIGVAQEISVNKLYAEMAYLMNTKKPAKYKKGRVGELNRSVLSNSKAKKVLGWSPKTSFRRALAETLEYFKEDVLS